MSTTDNAILAQLVFEAIKSAARVAGSTEEFPVRHKFTLADGSELSIQYSSWHWCSARDEDEMTMESTFEVWFPDDEDPTGHVSLNTIVEYLVARMPKLFTEEFLMIAN